MKNSKNLTYKSCIKHSREIEAFCQDCQELVCASCTMTASSNHKNHSFLQIKEASLHFRDLINQNGHFLSKEYTEERLLGLKEARLEVQLKAQDMIKSIDEISDSIIEKVKERRNFLCEKIEEICYSEIAQIQKEENKWREREKIQKRLLQFGTDQDDNQIIANFDLILEGVNNLKEKVTSYSAKVFNDFELNFKIKRKLEDMKENQHITQAIAVAKNYPENNGYVQIKSNTEIEIKLEIEEIVDIISSMIQVKEPYFIEYLS